MVRVYRGVWKAGASERGRLMGEIFKHWLTSLSPAVQSRIIWASIALLVVTDLGSVAFAVMKAYAEATRAYMEFRDWKEKRRNVNQI